MYSPKIDETLIPALYRIGKAINKPMTHVVNMIISQALMFIPRIEEWAAQQEMQKNNTNNSKSKKEPHNGREKHTGN